MFTNTRSVSRRVICSPAVAGALLLIGLQGAVATPLGTAFTYQGRLMSGGSPANGLHDLHFRLYDALMGGAQVGTTVCADNVSVTDGLFTVSLDFGAQFAGQQRFLEIGVRADTGLDCAGLTGFVILGPRQPLTAAPNASFAMNASAAANSTQLNGQPAAFYQNASNINSGTLADARLSSNVALLDRENSFLDAQHFYQIPEFLAAGAPFYVESPGLVTRLNADLLDGLDSTVFLQSVPVPLTLNGTSATHIIQGANASTINGAAGLRGLSFAANGATYGVWGYSVSTAGRGVVGESAANTGFTSGVFGSAASGNPNGRGVSGSAGGYGVYGLGGNTGVYGTGSIFGVQGESPFTTGIGVYGYVSAGSGATKAILGECISPSGFAVYSAGNLACTGNKQFRIDHPLDPENKYLSHYCTEGPEPLNVYTGTTITDAQGYGTVALPDYFAEINRDFRYQLTVIDDREDFILTKVVREIKNNDFVIRTSRPSVKVSWEVKGVRNDPWVRTYGAQVETQKAQHERGKYEHPELYGQPPEKGMRYDAMRNRPEPERPSLPTKPVATPG